ncbi:DUF2496 domain-containing protein [Paraphotobacterium marinum]|uniref:DUF2496 domain-containing protein n=1 Tax=Paraphotobacterium marinum TaxID=1755811 RepID=A0A220VDM3_9GAMM|nr:YbaM family protein [Paraphotobacterium marinum]ASK78518.1 DUF2496 domain-containing protein [Paraphotobacterium marinum]
MRSKRKLGLEKEKDHIKLAVDLILLLEQNNISPNTALKAIEIVKKDFEKKMEENFNS